MAIDTPPAPGPGLETHGPGEPPQSAQVRRFLLAHGVKEHNHASEIARIIVVDRSQAYRRLKGEVGWSHHDLRAIARHFGAPEDHLLPPADASRRPVGAAPEAVPALVRIRHLPPLGHLVPGPALGPQDSSDLVAVRGPSGWEVWLHAEAPGGLPRHAVESLTLRSPAHLQVALLEDDLRSAQALVEALRLQGVAVSAFAGRDGLLAALSQQRFDAFVLDWLLPDGTAAEVVEAIRRDRANGPIVVVTGALMADNELEHSLQELSARWNFSTLDKPVRPLNLANTIKQLVSVARGG